MATMAVTDHDRKVGALLGLDPAKIAENRTEVSSLMWRDAMPWELNRQRWARMPLSPSSPLAKPSPVRSALVAARA